MKEWKEAAARGLGWFNPDPDNRRRSGQPEVFRFYSGRDLGIRKAGEQKKKHERRAGETVRGNDEAGTDPFLQASNLAADIMQNSYPHADCKEERRAARRQQRRTRIDIHPRWGSACSQTASFIVKRSHSAW